MRPVLESPPEVNVRITYSTLSPGRRHPLRQAAVRELVASVGAELGEGIHVYAIHFGWNARMTQEARVVQRGQDFDIRINFTVSDGQSRMLALTGAWMEPVIKCGGAPDRATRLVQWRGDSAARYCSFLVLHELAHILYARKRSEGRMKGWRSSTHEEAWCDEWALAHVLNGRGSDVAEGDEGERRLRSATGGRSG